LKRERTTSGTVWARRAVQGLFLLLFLFLFLQTEQKGADELGYPVKLFLDFDPLLFLAALLSSHALVGAFWLSIATLLVTARLGRVFCGWVCPLGTLNNLVGTLRKWPARPRLRGWFHVKYLVLAGLLTAAFGFQWVGVLDPLSLTVRSLALGVYPALNTGLNALLDVLYTPDAPFFRAVAEGASSFLQQTVLAFQPPRFVQGALVGALFAGILALNLVERRFWCRYLCPLGALLGVAGRWTLLKRNVSEGCTSCGLCDHGCQGGASTGEGQGWRPSECVACFNCGDACPTSSASFGFSARPSPDGVDLSRRRILLAAADIAINIFALESTVLRAEKNVAKVSEAKRTQLLAAVQIFAFEATEAVTSAARKAAFFVEEGDTLNMILSGIRRFGKYDATGLLASKRALAKAVRATGAKVYELAVKKKIGTELPN